MSLPPLLRVLSCLLPLVLIGITTSSICLAAENQTQATDARPARPNVILIMADDLSYADLSCYGSEKLRTPVLDQLAKEGIRLTSFYAGCTICTPSRMALLTGAYPRRVGWEGGVLGFRIPRDNGLSPEAITIAEVFQSAGYRTGIIGKWHLGDVENLSPLKQGFDEAYYLDKSNNQTKQIWRNGKVEVDPFDNRRLTELFAGEAIRFIKENRDREFFLYLPLSAPHFPAESHPDWKGKSEVGAYGDVVEEMDSRLGDIFKTLRDEKLTENTIVVFLSDNGVEGGQKKWARSTPYRGLKWSSLEGGNRVPCMIRWPGKIPAGQESDAIVAAIDLFPTLASACHIELKSSSENALPLDGVNVLPLLMGKTDARPRDTFLYWEGWGTLQAIRQGEWKLFLDQVKDIPETADGPVLIHLTADPQEQENLSKKHPDRVQAMLAEAAKQLADIEANSIPLGGPQRENGTVRRPKWLPQTD